VLIIANFASAQNQYDQDYDNLSSTEEETEVDDEDEYQEEEDNDGCYIPQRYPEHCVSVESTRWSGDQLIVKFRNNCEARVYGTMCLKRKDGTADCGADGIAQGGLTTYYAYDAEGTYAYKFTGSTKSGSDWVCADRYHDPEYYDQDLESELGIE
jgi:hypothetical protein